jgi:hypothetical protein
MFRALILSTIFFLNVSQAEPFSIPTLDSTQTDAAVRTFANSFTFRSVEPASDLGRVWGFYIGAGANLNSLSAVSTVFNGVTTPFIPTGDIQVGLTIPFGLTVELGVLPPLSFNGASFKRYAGNVKWKFNSLIFPEYLFDLSARVGYSFGNLNFTQNTGTVINVDYGGTMLSAQLLASRSFLFFEPYIGLGFANAASTLTGTGGTPLFTSGLVATSVSNLSFYFTGGLLLKFWVIGLGAEFDSLFGITSWNFKFSVRI